MDKTVVFGGTFNPFHNGHFEIVKSLLLLEGVEKVIVMPTATPPHKPASMLATGDDRIAMCRLALAGCENVIVSDLEIKRGGRSFTYDTICALRDMGEENIAIACGADMITTLNSWYRYRDIINLADIIAYRRAGIENEDFDNAVESIKGDGGNVTVIECNIIDISSSRIREGDFSKVSPPVFEYITNHHLYGVQK